MLNPNYPDGARGPTVPADIEECVSAIGDKPGVDEPYALCNWMKSEGKGYFAAGEKDISGAVKEFAEVKRQNPAKFRDETPIFRTDFEDVDSRAAKAIEQKK